MTSPRRRFWKEAATASVEGGFGVLLDGKGLKTPGGEGFRVPTEALAGAVCEEWGAQGEKIAPDTMPMFRFAVTAIDRVAPRRAAVVEEIGNYGASDLLCYREERDQSLRARQEEVWQPYLDWAAGAHGIALEVAGGVMPRPQPEAALARAHAVVDGYDEFRLAGLHSLVATSGSLVLGLAAAEGRATAEEAGEAALLDELWHQEKWGADEEAGRRIEGLRRTLAEARRYLDLLSA